MTVITALSPSVAAFPEIHWGNLGSFLGGLAAVVLASFAIIGGSAGLQDWRAKVRQQRALAEEETKNIRLNRRRVLQGWSPTGVSVYGVRLVTDPTEMRRASEELLGRRPSEYVVLRVSEGDGNEARAHNLRSLIEAEGYVSRAPSTGEYEALQVGRQQLLAAPEAEA